MGIALIASAAALADGPVLKVALTFDDLPLNGTLPAGVTRVEITRDTLAFRPNTSMTARE
jgi:hypothetical protein